MILERKETNATEKETKVSGAKCIVNWLKVNGHTIVFGYPGGQIIPVFDALYDEQDIRVVLCKHEQAAVHAADGYARVTGRPGICIVTSGPGATNTITGLATAYADSVPLICISGQVPRNLLGKESFQEADILSLTKAVTKRNYLVLKRSELPGILDQAYAECINGRTRPVLIDIPKDVQIETGGDSTEAELDFFSSFENVSNDNNLENTASVIAAIGTSQKPLFFFGGGVNRGCSAEAVQKLVEVTGIPAVTSLMGIGTVPTSHPLNLGMIGMHGSITGNLAVTSCDLLIGIGVRFDDRVTGSIERFAPYATIVHVDIDPQVFSRNVFAHMCILADAGAFVNEMLSMTVSMDSPEYKDWYMEIDGYKKLDKRYEQRYAENAGEVPNQGNGLRPQSIMNTIRTHFPANIICTEVGQHQMWTAQYMPFSKEGQFITSGGLGTMGFGFPAAMGAQIALQKSGSNEKVVLIAGDGSIQMNIQELSTCVQENIPLLIIILNNGYLGMVRQWQELFYEKRYSSTCLNSQKECSRACGTQDMGCESVYPDFSVIARAYGIRSWTACSQEQFDEALGNATTHSGPVFINCYIGREENVWPIVPPGAGNDQMLYDGEEVVFR